MSGIFDREESFVDGEIIVREGDISREMFILQRGSVVVTKNVDGREVTLAVLGRGSFFGEMSLLESLPRNATVRACGDTRVLILEPGSLLLKIRRDPTFAFEMLQHMSQRIRDLDERLVALLGQRPAAAADERRSRVVLSSTSEHTDGESPVHSPGAAM